MSCCFVSSCFSSSGLLACSCGQGFCATAAFLTAVSECKCKSGAFNASYSIHASCRDSQNCCCNHKCSESTWVCSSVEPVYVVSTDGTITFGGALKATIQVLMSLLNLHYITVVNDIDSVCKKKQKTSMYSNALTMEACEASVLEALNQQFTPKWKCCHLLTLILFIVYIYFFCWKQKKILWRRLVTKQLVAIDFYNILLYLFILWSQATSKSLFTSFLQSIVFWGLLNNDKMFFFFR